MTKAKLLEAVTNGETIMAGEYIGSVAETISWRDKTTGKAMTAPTLRHTIMTGSKSVLVRERCADDSKPDSYGPPYSCMQSVVCTFWAVSSPNGAVHAEGKLEALTD